MSGHVLRRAAAAADLGLAVPAARALWQVDGSTDAALAVAGRCLDGDSEYAWRDAAGLLAELGEATGDPARALPVLERVWTTNVHTRRRVAALWAELGPVAADSAPPLTAELGQAEREQTPSPGVRVS